MGTLNDHISRVERYGFVRECFPVEYNGHKLVILQNDAHETNDNRLLYDFTLFCVNCRTEDGVSGRFPSHAEDVNTHVVAAKIACFEKFKFIECE